MLGSRFRVLSGAVVVGLVGALLTVGQPARSAFPGSNGKIVFSRTGSGDSGPFPGFEDEDIVLMNADGTEPVLLTPEPGNDKSPSFNATGTKIVYQHTSSEELRPESHTFSALGQIWVMNPDGTTKQPLTPNETDAHPHFCPDGRIVFERRVDGPGDIFIMNGDGTLVSNLTNTPEIDEVTPTCSPDGTRIAFGNNSRDLIETMNIDGTGRRIAVQDIGDPRRPDWSPDSRLLVFFNRVFTEEPEGEELAVAQVGGIYTVLADGPESPTQITVDPADKAPSFSPDGTMIVFWNDEADEIFVVEAAGTPGRTRLTNSPEGVENKVPDWQPVPTSDGDGDGDGTATISGTVSSAPLIPFCGPFLSAFLGGLCSPSPVSGATVSADSTSTTTDASGNFSLTVAPGTYTVAASVDSTSCGSQNVTVADGGTADADFSCPGGFGGFLGGGFGGIGSFFSMLFGGGFPG